MEIEAQRASGFYQKDIAAALGVHPAHDSRGRSRASAHRAGDGPLAPQRQDASREQQDRDTR